MCCMALMLFLPVAIYGLVFAGFGRVYGSYVDI